ncbi:ornithine decarboxylase [Caerostris darwini]|uniref:Ornithine decarboxylase n=1 Tax=Caerostris darwini TaxID=1538125 RepID=A0AAV4UWX3_9ARAC|nr:ornithine decarboxylase [Caerostris darwini]
MDPRVKEEIDRLCSIAKKELREEPFLVFDSAEVEKKVKEWKEAMPRVDMFYAVKVNSDPVLLRTLAALNVGFDCGSKNEIDAVISLGVPPNRIVYANCYKGASHLRHAAQLRVDFTVFDNREELVKIKLLYPRSRLLLRIKIVASSAFVPMSCKFGCDLDKANDLLRFARSLDLTVIGVCFHIGSLTQDPKDFEGAIRLSRSLFDVAKSLDMKLTVLDIGGGFPGCKGSSDLFRQMAVSVNRAIDEYFPADGHYTIIAEPGRYVVTSAFTLCASIIGKKEKQTNEGSEVMYIINEGIYGLFAHNLFHGYTPKPVLKKEWTGEELHPSSVWGQSCDPVDVIVEKCKLPHLKVGDWLTIDDMGAYTIVCSSTFNGFEKTEVKYIMSRKQYSFRKEA